MAASGCPLPAPGEALAYRAALVEDLLEDIVAIPGAVFSII
jgi:hypothetical protein